MQIHTQKESLYSKILRTCPRVAEHIVQPAQIRRLLQNPPLPPSAPIQGGMRLNSRKNRGFTLIELLAVVVCITIFSAVLLVSNQNSAQQANDAVYEEQKAQLKEALESWVVAQPSMASARATLDAATSQAAMLELAQTMMSPATRGNYRIIGGQIVTDATLNNKQSLRLVFRRAIRSSPKEWAISVGEPMPTPYPEPPLQTPTPSPSVPTPTPDSSPTATPDATEPPTATPSPTVPATPTPGPTGTPTPQASASPSPTASPTGSPSATPVVQSPGDTNFGFGNSSISPDSTEVGHEILLTVVPVATGAITDTVWLYLSVPQTMTVELVTPAGWTRDPDFIGNPGNPYALKLVVLHLDVPTAIGNPVLSLISPDFGKLLVFGRIGYAGHMGNDQPLAQPWWKAPATPTPTPTPTPSPTPSPTPLPTATPIPTPLPFVEVAAEPATPAVISGFWTSGTMTVKFRNPNPYSVPYHVYISPTSAFMDGGNNIYGTAYANSVEDISSHLNFKSLGANPSFVIKIYRNGATLDITSNVVWPVATPSPTP